jgi:vancomycin resistance protein VanW
MEWMFGTARFAKTRKHELLPYQISKHRTPMLRQLKDVDMWLQHNKIINLKIAMKRLHGIMIMPGETFSYWRLIGKPTRRKGYVDGMVLFYGGFKPGVGGGLCQLSNLLYWITLHTPLEVTERHRHSYDVFPDSNRTQPFGSGATCAYNYLDFRIKNNTNEPYQLYLDMEDGDLTGEWRTTQPPLHSYEIYEKEHRISQHYWGGYERYNSIYRKVFNQGGELIADEFITENRALMMYQPFLESGT